MNFSVGRDIYIHNIFFSTYEKCAARYCAASSLFFTFTLRGLSQSVDDDLQMIYRRSADGLKWTGTVWAALLAYETGHYVAAKEFSQDHLENTYISLLGVLQDQRAGKSAKTFNTTMHELYRKVS
ncbi:hypothetical protein K438DRAFT_1764828 [Mycena galopus ATCC 62051]|nr:hypothetical protein K438DRAFT_1764828 [Mycena galopus ATCC 62051]